MAWPRRFLNVFRRAEISRAIEDEFQFHVDEHVDELIAQGYSEPEARRMARRRFGNATWLRESTGDLHLSRAVESATEDIRYAVRSLRRAPAFALSAIATLALGIGATTAIYSVVHTVWLRPLPFRDPGRVVRVWETNLPLGISSFSASILNYLSWCERSTSFDSLVAMRAGGANLTGRGDPERVVSVAVTARFFDALGIRPVRGRSFVPGEDSPGGGRVVMLSERLWRQRYGGDPGLIGRQVAVNSENRTVVGIAPSDVAFSGEIDVWEPLTLDPARENRGDHTVVVLGRLKPGVMAARAQAELSRLAAQLEREFPNSNRDWRVRLAPVLSWIVNRQTRAALVVLLIAVGLLLAVACVNAANLLVARASSRVQEFGIRQALGAGRGRLVRQLVIESLVLAVASGAAGLAVAALGVEGLRAILPAGVPRAAQLSLDLPVLAGAIVLTVVTGLVFGLVPAWVVTRTDVQTSLRQGRGATTGPGRLRLRQALVAGEFALATVLVCGAGLLLASFQRLQAVPLGFEAHNVLTARITLSEAQYTYERAQAFYRDLGTALNAEPGIDAAGIASNVPLGGGDTKMSVMPGDAVLSPAVKPVMASWRIATPGYFKVLRIPLVRGRFFEERDEASGRPILLSETLVRHLWPDGRDPIGRLVRLGENKPFTVVGVVGEVRQLALNEEPMPAVYLRPPSISGRP